MHKEDKTLEKASITLDGAISRPLYFLSHILNQKSALITPRPEKEKIAELSPYLCLEGELHLQLSSLLLSIKKVGKNPIPWIPGVFFPWQCVCQDCVRNMNKSKTILEIAIKISTCRKFFALFITIFLAS